MQSNIDCITSLTDEFTFVFEFLHIKNCLNIALINKCVFNKVRNIIENKVIFPIYETAKSYAEWFASDN